MDSPIIDNEIAHFGFLLQRVQELSNALDEDLDEETRERFQERLGQFTEQMFNKKREVKQILEGYFKTVGEGNPISLAYYRIYKNL